MGIHGKYLIYLEPIYFINVLLGPAMQRSGILQPVESSPCGHDIWPSPQLLGQEASHIPKPYLFEGAETNASQNKDVTKQRCHKTKVSQNKDVTE